MNPKTELTYQITNWTANVDKIRLDIQVDEIKESRCSLPIIGDLRMLYLRVVGETNRACLWDVELPLLESLEDLDGQRIHVRPDGECYDDDTLGTDMVGAYSTSDLNFWDSTEDSLLYGDIRVDFNQIEGRTFRVRIEMTLSDSEDDPEDLPPEAFDHVGKADFVVTVDEKNPYDE